MGKKRFRMVTSYSFEPDQYHWLASCDAQAELIPKAVKEAVLFTVTPTLDKDGRYRGHSYVRCYEFKRPHNRNNKPRILYDDEPA